MIIKDIFEERWLDLADVLWERAEEKVESLGIDFVKTEFVDANDYLEDRIGGTIRTYAREQFNTLPQVDVFRNLANGIYYSWIDNLVDETVEEFKGDLI